jgi:amino acid adenylation domain-containing protein
LTYRELAAQAAQFAQTLWDCGISPGARIALWLPKEMNTYIALHGALAAGCSYVPIDLSAPPKRAAWILENSNSAVLVCRATDAVLIQPYLPANVRVLLVLPKPEIQLAPSSSHLSVVRWEAISKFDEQGYSDAHLSRDQETLAYILYTSGSTGTPKGVAISHRAAQAFIDWAASLCTLGPEDHVSNHSSLSFDLSIFDVFAAARAGACLCPVTMVGLASGYVFARFIEDEAITVWYSVPLVLTRITRQQQQRPFRLASLRTVIFAGETFPKPELQRFAAALPGVALYNWYGPTETNVCVWHQVTEADLASDAALPIGRPCPYASVVLQPDGEALVRGASLLSGYMRQGEVDPSPLISLPDNNDGPYYRTNDILSYRTDGSLLYHGRRDLQFKRNGYRIEAGEIEAVARAMSGISDTALIVAKNRIILCVVSPAQVSRENLLSWLTSRLSSHMIPDDIVQLPELPRNDRGKTDRLLLQTMMEHENNRA